jgi:hypothetical protein
MMPFPWGNIGSAIDARFPGQTSLQVPRDLLGAAPYHCIPRLFPQGNTLPLPCYSKPYDSG